jgi:hypothetical protein
MLEAILAFTVGKSRAILSNPQEVIAHMYRDAVNP